MLRKPSLIVRADNWTFRTSFHRENPLRLADVSRHSRSVAQASRLRVRRASRPAVFVDGRRDACATGLLRPVFPPAENRPSHHHHARDDKPAQDLPGSRQVGGQSKKQHRQANPQRQPQRVEQPLDQQRRRHRRDAPVHPARHQVKPDDIPRMDRQHVIGEAPGEHRLHRLPQRQPARRPQQQLPLPPRADIHQQIQHDRRHYPPPINAGHGPHQLAKRDIVEHPIQAAGGDAIAQRQPQPAPTRRGCLVETRVLFDMHSTSASKSNHPSRLRCQLKSYASSITGGIRTLSPERGHSCPPPP